MAAANNITDKNVITKKNYSSLNLSGLPISTLCLVSSRHQHAHVVLSNPHPHHLTHLFAYRAEDGGASLLSAKRNPPEARLYWTTSEVGASGLVTAVLRAWQAVLAALRRRPGAGGARVEFPLFVIGLKYLLHPVCRHLVRSSGEASQGETRLKV